MFTGLMMELMLRNDNPLVDCIVAALRERVQFYGSDGKPDNVCVLSEIRQVLTDKFRSTK